MYYYHTNDEIDEIGEGIIRKYNYQAFIQGDPTDIEGFIADHLNYRIVYDRLADKDAGRMAFLADGKDTMWVWRDGKRVEVIPPEGMIVIDEFAELGEKADSSVQGGTRPVIVLQNNSGNRSSPTVIVAPITSKLEKPHLPTHVVLGQSNLPKQSMVLLEQVMTIDQKLLIKEYGEILRGYAAPKNIYR